MADFTDCKGSNDSLWYDALPSQLHFRLLIVNARSSTSDEIRCSLEIHNITESPSFSAISYTWGSNVLVDSILVDGHLVPVTHNLVRALKELPPSADERTVWIDAICINQADTAERKSQVQLMKHIFSRAEKVYAWIGDELHHDSQSVEQNCDMIEWLVDVAEMNVTYSYGMRIRQSPESNSGNQLRSLVLDRGHLLPGVEPIPLKFHITPILRSAWASRAWVLQEVALARSCVVYWSGFEASWDIFTQALHKIYRLRTTPSPEIRLFLTKDRFRLALRSTPWMRLFLTGNPSRIALQSSRNKNRYYPMYWRQVLPVVSCLNSGDPRDKIYSALGLVTEADASPFAPDYSQDTRGLYIKLARHLYETDGPEALVLVDQNHEVSKSIFVPSELRSLPSWVPDLIDKSCAGHRQRIYNETSRYFEALERGRELATIELPGESGDAIPLEKTVDPIDTSTTSQILETLCIKGRVVSKVSKLGPINLWLAARGQTPDQGQTFAHVLRQWLEMAQSADEAGPQKILELLLGHGCEIAPIFEKFIKMDWPKLVKSLLSDNWLALPPAEVLPCVLGTVSLQMQQEFSEWNMATLERRLMFLEDGRIGFTPADTCVGDSVVIFDGSSRDSPSRFALHRVENGWRLVGKCEVYLPYSDEDVEGYDRGGDEGEENEEEPDGSDSAGDKGEYDTEDNLRRRSLPRQEFVLI